MRPIIRNCAAPDDRLLRSARYGCLVRDLPLLLLLSVLVSGCTLLQEQICVDEAEPDVSGSAVEPGQGAALGQTPGNTEGSPSSGGSDDGKSDRFVFLYSRAKYILNPVVMPGSTEETNGEVLHMCWYNRFWTFTSLSKAFTGESSRIPFFT